MDKPPRVSQTGSLHFKRGLGLPAKEQEQENSALEAQETRETQAGRALCYDLKDFRGTGMRKLKSWKMG